MRYLLGLALTVGLASAAVDSLGCRLVGSYDIAAEPRVWGVAVSGNYAYVGHDVLGVMVFDISDPAAPESVAVCATSNTAQHLVIDGDYLYLAGGSEVSVIDISTPTSPSVVETLSSGGYSLGLTKVGNYLYVANYSATDGLTIIDASTPTDLSIVGSCNTPYKASGVAVSGDYAYVAIQDSGMVVVDISDPEAPEVVTRYDSSGVGEFVCERVTVNGNYAYLSEKSEVVVLDISDPPNTHKVTLYDAPHYTGDAQISLHYMYVGCQDMTVVDITDPESPAEVGHYSNDPQIWDNVVVANGYVYAVGDSGLTIFQFYGGNISFVSPTGDGDNPGTEAEPFLTIQRGIDSAQAGEYVHIKAGTYNEVLTFPNNGSADSVITIQGEVDSEGNLLAIIDGTTPIDTPWTAAPEVGDGVYKKVGYAATLMLWQGNQLIRINAASMAGDSNGIYDKGFNILNYDSNKVWGSYSPPTYNTPFWQDVMTIYGVLNGETTYVRHVDRSWDPDTCDMRGVEGDSVVGITLDGNDYITLEHLQIQHYPTAIRFIGSSHNIIRDCVIRGGDQRTHMIYGSDSNVVQRNLYESAYGDYALFGEWGTDSDTLLRRAAQYALNKYVEGAGSSFNRSLDLYSTAGNLIDSNEVRNGSLGIFQVSSPGTTISHNHIHNHVSVAVFMERQMSGLRIFDNDCYHNNTCFRKGALGTLNDTVSIWIYNNRAYNIAPGGEFFKWYAEGYDRAQTPNLWFYHNSVAGFSEATSLDTVSTRRAKIVNNIFSVYSVALASSATADSVPDLFAAFDYNFCGGIYRGYRYQAWMFRDRNNQWADDTMAGDIDHQVWPLNEEPNWVVPDTSTAHEAALDVFTDSFVVRGVTYGPLPGSVGYHADLGAWGVGDTTTPPAATYGSVNATSTPAGASVWFDGVDTDSVTPCVTDSVETGSLIVKFTLAGYTDYSDTVMVTEGDTVTVNKVLVPNATPSTFTIQGNPGAMWW